MPIKSEVKQMCLQKPAELLIVVSKTQCLDIMKQLA